MTQDHLDPSAIERVEARAFCEAHGIPCILEPEDSERDRRAVGAMERVPTAAGVACYLAGVRWTRVAMLGAKPYWEVAGFDRRPKPTAPPAFGIWLDGTPNPSLANTSPALLEVLQRDQAAAVSAFESGRAEPAPAITREQALAIYQRQVEMTRKMAPNIQILVAVDAIMDGARVATAAYAAAFEAVWPSLANVAREPAAPAWLVEASDLVANGTPPARAIVTARWTLDQGSVPTAESGATSSTAARL